MIFNSLIKPKATLTTLPETATLNEALTILEDTGYRCVPVLDKSGKIFRGNIYKMHLYRHKARNGDMHLPVTALLKNATKFISINAAFFSIFFAIRDLPYIAVLDNNNQLFRLYSMKTLQYPPLLEINYSFQCPMKRFHFQDEVYPLDLRNLLLEHN